MRRRGTCANARARSRRRLLSSLALAAGLAACAGGSGDDARPDPSTPGPSTASTSATPGQPAQQSPTAAPIFGKPILIETQIQDAAQHRATVLKTSVIGESAFCRGGTATGGSEGAAITTTFTCRDGTLTVRYAPTQVSLVQGATWTVVSGTGTLAGLRGGGSMVAVFDEDDPDIGRETFTGTVGEQGG